MALTKIEASNIAAGAVASSGFVETKFKTASETYTVPADITKIVIDLVSAGGGGGGGAGPTWSSGGSAGSNAIKNTNCQRGSNIHLNNRCCWRCWR